MRVRRRRRVGLVAAAAAAALLAPPSASGPAAMPVAEPLARAGTEAGAETWTEAETETGTATGADGLWSLAADRWPAPPAVDAASWILVEVTSGQVLAEHDADALRPPASTTKLLTALAVSRRTDPDDVVVVPAEAVGLEGATAGLRAGQRVHVDDLLVLLLLRSGNDAAAALAIHVGGSLEGFAAMLRAEADVLGLGDAVLAEPHGLHDGNRLAARDLAVVGRAVLADPELRPLVAAPSARLRDGSVVENRNELLGAYPGSTGLKTGMTRAAGWSLVASARRGPRHLVAVVLGGPTARSRFTASATLLDHGFEGFAPPPAPPELRVRGEGRWLEVRPVGRAGLLPLGAAARLEPGLPVELEAPTLRWSWVAGSGSPPGRWDQATRLSPVAPGRSAAPVGRRLPGPVDADGTAHLGAWLSGRVQAGLRAATVAGRWSSAG